MPPQQSNKKKNKPAPPPVAAKRPVGRPRKVVKPVKPAESSEPSDSGSDSGSESGSSSSRSDSSDSSRSPSPKRKKKKKVVPPPKKKKNKMQQPMSRSSTARGSSQLPPLRRMPMPPPPPPPSSSKKKQNNRRHESESDDSDVREISDDDSFDDDADDLRIRKTNSKSQARLSKESLSDDQQQTPEDSDSDSDRISKETAFERRRRPVLSAIPGENDYVGFRLTTKPAIFVLTGKQGSGKSHMIRYLFYEWCKGGHFKGGGIVFSPTAFNGDYDFMPKDKVHRVYDENYLIAYIENMRKLTEQGKAQHGKQFELKPNFVIFDDLLGKIRQTPEFLNLVACYRHTNTSFLFCNQMLQAVGNVSTFLRNSTCYAMMWPSILRPNVDACFNAYGGVYKTQEEFEMALNAGDAPPYSCLVYKYGTTLKEHAYARITAGDVPDDFSMIF